VSGAATLAGWAAAALAAGLALIAWRALGGRMEAVARACHELRGPITAARLGLELGASVGELSPARLRAIDFELRQAALALDDLADARYVRRELHHCEPVDVHALLVDSVEGWRPRAGSEAAELQLRWSGEPVRVWGDRLRLAQATGNLIANAIEHGGGVVEVRGRAVATGARIEVSDEGPGLPAPVTELARRAHRGRGARGRGLAITAGVAKAHGGRLLAASGETGATLVLELPASPRRVAEAREPTGRRRRPGLRLR
jgi:signal transduction histidine kinase